MKENFGGITNLSICSVDDCENDDEHHHTDNFRLSSYVNKISAAPLGETASFDLGNQHVQNIMECRSSQTSPMMIPCSSDAQSNAANSKSDIDKQTLKSLCESVFDTVTSFRGELSAVRGLIKQPFENREDFPIQKIMRGKLGKSWFFQDVILRL